MKPTYCLLGLFFLLRLSLAGQQNSLPSPAKTNFLIIMADDLGYSDLGCYGGEIQTPNLDALAANGLRFRNFYNTARCCPTRAALLTGQYQHKVGLSKNGQSMNRKGVTIAEVLKAQQYQTGMVGKWHLTEAKPLPDPVEHLQWLNHQKYLDKDFGELDTYPTRRGFDQFYGIVWGVIDYFDPFSLVNGEQPVQDRAKDYYITNDFTQKSVAYIEGFAKQEAPFFLYVAYTAPHWPIHALPADIEKYKDTYSGGWEVLRKNRYDRQVKMGLIDPAKSPLNPLEGRKWESLSAPEKAFNARKMAVHAAMVDRVDQGVGAIIAALKKTGQLDHTVILFLADNGASPEIPRQPGYDRNSATRTGQKVNYKEDISLEALGSQTTYTGIGPEWANAVNTPYRYWKYESYGGGIRTPAIIHWGGLQTGNGQIVDELSHVMDFMPTVLDLSGANYPKNYQGNDLGHLDGHSLLPTLQNKQRNGYQNLYFEHENGKAMIAGDWKITLLRSTNEWGLYNLKDDPTEAVDLSETYPEKLKALKANWQKWFYEVTAGTEMDRKRQNARLDHVQTAAIRIRDPFIVADKKSQTYYMYAQMQNRQPGEEAPQGVEVYTSKDLENWTAPKPVLTLADDFWARKSVWAPEVHVYKGAFYLFVTLTSSEKLSETPNPENGAIQWKRGTHIFKADAPEGPFRPLQKQAHTPADWMSLDGTLWVENGKPYMAFCHEWAQTFDGTIEVVELAPDLSKPIGKPQLLFKASAADWARNMKDIGYKQNGLVTDGPFFYKNTHGELIMIWSSFGEQEYAIGQARSTTGSIFGPWEQMAEPLVKANGGHGMIFYTLEGQLMLAFHQPNSREKERLHLKKIGETETGLLAIVDEQNGSAGPVKKISENELPSPAPPGWEALFNGKNLAGWHLATRDTTFAGTMEDLFEVKNGLIHVYPSQENLSEQTFAGLITEQTYSHYKLSLEYKWGTRKFKPRHEFVRDAGIIFHVHGADQIWPNGVECQIQEGDTGDLWAIGTRVSSKVQNVIRNYDPNGELVTMGKPEQRFHRFHRAYSWEVPGWNKIDIEVKGDHAIFMLNGKIVNEAIAMQYWEEESKTYRPLTAGKILIQAEGAELYYRNIFIQPL